MRATAMATGLAAAALLSACGLQSSTPLFTPKDASSQRLHEGIWALAGPGCELGPAPTPATLPECAVTVRIAGGMLTPLGRLADSDAIKPTPILLVENRPLILQMAGDSAKVEYYGLRPTANDAAGRILRGVGWVLSCLGAKVLDQCSVDTPDEVRARADHISPLQSALLTWIAP